MGHRPHLVGVVVVVVVVMVVAVVVVPSVKDTTTSETNTIEHLLLVSSEPTKVPVKPRMHYAGDSSSTGIGPVGFASADTAMKATWAVKKKLFGKYIRRVGGPGGAPTADEDKGQKHARKDSDIDCAFSIACALSGTLV